MCDSVSGHERSWPGARGEMQSSGSSGFGLQLGDVGVGDVVPAALIEPSACVLCACVPIRWYALLLSSIVVVIVCSIPGSQPSTCSAAVSTARSCQSMTMGLGGVRVLRRTSQDNV